MMPVSTVDEFCGATWDTADDSSNEAIRESDNDHMSVESKQSEVWIKRMVARQGCYEG